jgi:hypothetical protein
MLFVTVHAIAFLSAPASGKSDPFSSQGSSWSPTLPASRRSPTSRVSHCLGDSLVDYLPPNVALPLSKS